MANNETQTPLPQEEQKAGTGRQHIQRRPVSPRQKMINLMYIVLLAMLALNISPDVLNGFTLVENSLSRSTQNATEQNRSLYGNFEEQLKANPAKVREWYEKAASVRAMSDSLYNLAHALREAIVREADGKDADPANLRNKEDLEAASQVMLAPGRGQGSRLYRQITSYRERILRMVDDPVQRNIISSNFSTDVPKKQKAMGKNWVEYMFESTPAAAAATLLTKLQNDVRYAEGEVLHTLAKNIDLKDVRVNQLNAYVVPNAQTIVQGGKFSARIIMAAVDTTQQPQIYIGGRPVSLRGGLYETVCSSVGDFTLAGHIEMADASGSTVRREFQQKYSVVAPSATVSADMMNVLYAGYDNPVSVSVPGVPSNKISATMTGGTLTAHGPGKYIARPAKIGENAVITISSQTEAGQQRMGAFSFRVRKLPDPTAYIPYSDEKGNPAQYIGVISFETVFFDNMGNAIPEVSNGDKFSERQKEIFRKLTRGRRFYINRVNAVGPDGTTRVLPQSLEVIVR